MSYELQKKLDAEGIRNYDTSKSNQKLKCPKCQPPHKPQDNPLSLTIKSDTALWNCHHCGYKGVWSESYTPYRPFEKKKEYAKPQVKDKPNKANFLYEFFNDRRITKNTVDAFKIYNEGNWIAFPYYDKTSNLANIKYRTKDKKFKQSPNTRPTLYNYDNIYKESMVIFVEGEMDVLSLAEVGFKNATTLPNGAPKEAKFAKDDARFEPLRHCPLSAKKIVLFTDNDSSGRALHKELLHRFGKDLCWYVSLPEGCKDANEVLMKHGAVTLKEMIDDAKPYPVDGLYTANDYWDQIQDLYEGNYEKPYEIGLKGLDKLYKILKGTFHVVTGIPNHGKSLFLDQILLLLAEKHGWKFAIYSPEHSTSMHIRRMLQMYIGKPFDENIDERISREELAKGLQFIHKHFFFIEAKEATPNLDFILKVAKSAIFKHGIDGVIIDPYNEVDAKRSGNAREDEHIRDFISTCKRFTKIYEIVFWVVAHPTKLPKTDRGTYQPPTAYDISGAAHWHNQADVVLTVHRNFDDPTNEGDETTSVITRKIREQDLYGQIGQAKFIYDLNTKKFKPFEMIGEWDKIDFTKDT